MPEPVPTTKPQSSRSCHGRVISAVSATPTVSRSSAADTVRRRPKRSMIAAANGPIMPYRKMFTATAPLIVASDQPNSRSSGMISTPGVARTPAAISSTRNVTATMIT